MFLPAVMLLEGCLGWEKGGEESKGYVMVVGVRAYHCRRKQRKSFQGIEMATSCPPEHVCRCFWQVGTQGGQVRPWRHVARFEAGRAHELGEEVEVRWVGEGVGDGDSVQGESTR